MHCEIHSRMGGGIPQMTAFGPMAEDVINAHRTNAIYRLRKIFQTVKSKKDLRFNVKYI